ncbi:TetR/AcrR family transcriptional regulator [Nocardia sp. NPDC055029]
MAQPTLSESSAPADSTPGQARRLQLDYRRRKTLAVASEIFAMRGYHAATVEEIAKRAGFSKPILYTQFSGKLDLYLTVLQSHIDTFTGSVLCGLRSTAANPVRVRAAVQAYFDFVDHETQGFRLVFESDLTSEPSVQLRVRRATDTCINAVSEVVAHESGLSWHQAHLIAAGMVGASQFAAQYWLDTGRVTPKDEAVEAVIALCWGGLSVVPLRRAD